MQLVYKFDINHSDRLCAICRVTNNLYNQALYIVRNELKDNDRWLFYPDLDRIMKNVTNLEGTVNYRLVKSHVAQQTLRVLDKAMKGYVKAVKDWAKNPGKYNGKPELPCYHKRGGMSNAIYTNQSCKIHDGYIILDRMQIEAEELNGRYVKLAAFIDSGKMDEVVNDMYNKCLLEMQCCTMFDYIRLLDTRIQRMQGSDGAKVIKMNFGMAIMALKAGYPIRRSGWDGKGLMVFKQVPAHIESDIIPKMQSLPQSAKDLILKGKGFIDYTSQCLIYNENTGLADSWVPSISDVFADDWEIVV